MQRRHRDDDCFDLVVGDGAPQIGQLSEQREARYRTHMRVVVKVANRTESVIWRSSEITGHGSGGGPTTNKGGGQSVEPQPVLVLWRGGPPAIKASEVLGLETAHCTYPC